MVHAFRVLSIGKSAFWTLKATAKIATHGVHVLARSTLLTIYVPCDLLYKVKHGISDIFKNIKVMEMKCSFKTFKKS